MTGISIYIGCIIVLFLFFFNIFLIKKVYDLSIVIFKMEDALEKSLDILNERYYSMNEIFQRPVFFDSMEVRQVISDIKQCRDAVLLIASILTNDIGSEINEIEKKDSKT